MATGDPPVTPDLTGTADAADRAAASLQAATQAAGDAQEGFSALSAVGSMASTVFEKFDGMITNFTKTLNSSGGGAERAAAQFGLLSTSILGSRKAFEGVDFSGSGLSTFTEQFETFSNVLNNSPLKMGVDLLKQMGAPIKDVTDAAAKGKNALLTFAGQFLQSADNALKLQTATIQLAARTGNLGQIYEKAGPNLVNMNSILAAQNSIMTNTAKATGISNMKQIESYYMALGAVPKAMDSVVSSGTSAGGSISMLTATIKMAQGTGRDFSAVVKDLHQAFNDYGLEGEKALTFTARFSELSNKFGVELDVMKAGLMGATGAFQALTDAGDAAFKMTESTSNIMNQYVGGLKQAGMTGAHAVDTVKNMTNAMAGLNVAQKAFLSAQTGGPGGLMGAAKVEQMLRKGDTEGVMKMVMQTMQKTGLGKAVTLEEAGQSEAAAAQRQKQIMMLQQGPLGGLAKTPEDAGRLLETMRAKQEGRAPTTALDSQGLQKAIAKGTSIEEKSYTKMSEMNVHLQGIQKAAEASNLSSVQRASTISAGAQDLGPASAAQTKLREGMRANQTAAQVRGGQQAGDIGVEMGKKGELTMDKTSEYIGDTLTDFHQWFAQIPETLQAPLDTLKQSIAGGADEKTAQESLKGVMSDIKTKREAAAKMTGDQKKKALADAQAEEDHAKTIYKWYVEHGTVKRPGGDPKKRSYADPSMSSLDIATFGQPVSAGAQVGAAQRGQPARRGAPGAGAGVGTPDVQVTEEGSSGRIKVDVRVKVNEVGGQSTGVAPGANVSPS